MSAAYLHGGRDIRVEDDLAVIVYDGDATWNGERRVAVQHSMEYRTQP